MRPRIRSRVTPILLLALTAFLAGSGRDVASRALAEPASAPAGGAKTHDPSEASVTATTSSPASQAEIADLEGKIKALREEFHSQLDPLQSQIKTLQDKYEPQIKALEEQKRGLVEQGKPPAIQQLDQQEDRELASLADHEKAEIDRVKQRFADQRKALQQSYQERRREARGEAK